VDWVWQKLFEHIESSPKISAEFLDLIVRATENKMAPPVPAGSVTDHVSASITRWIGLNGLSPVSQIKSPPPWSSICTCYHAPEQHGAHGCAAYSARGEECKCIAARGALPREGS
jgi:hypothetical protein